MDSIAIIKKRLSKIEPHFSEISEIEDLKISLEMALQVIDNLVYGRMIFPKSYAEEELSKIAKTLSDGREQW